MFSAARRIFAFLRLRTEGSCKKTAGYHRDSFNKDCEKLLLREIKKADSQVLVAIYSITRRNITTALANAAKRGVSVHVKYDAKSSEWEDMQKAIQYLKKRKVKCDAITLKGQYAKMHHKFMVIDKDRVLTGSYNYTTSASTESYENLVLIASPAVATKFAEEFDSIKSK